MTHAPRRRRFSAAGQTKNDNGRGERPERNKTMNADIETLKMGIKHLPPTARRRAERALGIPPSEPAEHKVFVYGTLLSNECNCHRAPRARRQNAWTLGTLHDTGYGFPAIVLKGRTRIVGEVLTVDEDAFRSMDRLEGYPSFYRREQRQVNLVGGGRVLAWVYVMNRLPEGAKVIEGGDWRKYRRGE